MWRIVVFVLGVMLLVDGLYLIFLQKIHLGTILPVLLGILFIFTSCCQNKIRLWQQQSARFACFWRWAWRGFFLWLITLFGFFAYLHAQILSSQQQPIQQLSAIIVLGSQVQNGQPSPALASRLDTAVPLAQTFPSAKIVVTGGLGYQQSETEASVMGRYLQNVHHIEQQRIILEDKSTSTELNLKNSLPLLAVYHITPQQPIAIVTNDFHSLRAKKIAKKIGYQQIISISAPTPLLTRYNSWLREYFAFLSGWILREY